MIQTLTGYDWSSFTEPSLLVATLAFKGDGIPF